MPKTKSNSRPYNRNEKRAAAKTKKTNKRAAKAGANGKAAWSMNQYGTPGQQSQGRRTANMFFDLTSAKKIKPRRGGKK